MGLLGRTAAMLHACGVCAQLSCLGHAVFDWRPGQPQFRLLVGRSPCVHGCCQRVGGCWATADMPQQAVFVLNHVADCRPDQLSPQTKRTD